ncbi:MAG: hypothetical protein U0133_18690 [Gemmatimonadales bacterium]
MADLLLRDAESHEMRLSPEELTEGARDGRITDDWQVWHVRGERWIAIASHPVYRRSRPVVVKEPESPPRRSGELALIYPDNYRARATPAPVQTREFSDPTIPVLRPEEIARVLAPASRDASAEFTPQAAPDPDLPMRRTLRLAAQENLPTFTRMVAAFGF